LGHALARADAFQSTGCQQTYPKYLEYPKNPKDLKKSKRCIFSAGELQQGVTFLSPVLAS
jgi:hypothetical protein